MNAPWVIELTRSATGVGRLLKVWTNTFTEKMVIGKQKNLEIWRDNFRTSRTSYTFSNMKQTWPIIVNSFGPILDPEQTQLNEPIQKQHHQAWGATLTTPKWRGTPWVNFRTSRTISQNGGEMVEKPWTIYCPWFLSNFGPIRDTANRKMNGINNYKIIE